MTEYIPGSQIKIRVPCSNCQDGLVVIPHKESSNNDVIKLHSRGYCPKCSGSKWIDKWISIETLNRWVGERR